MTISRGQAGGEIADWPDVSRCIQLGNFFVQVETDPNLAVQQPGKGAAVKTEGQQAVLAMHRMRQQLVKGRTMQINSLRGLLTGYGEVMSRSRKGLDSAIPDVLARLANRLPTMLIETLREQWNNLVKLDEQIVSQYPVEIQGSCTCFSSGAARFCPTRARPTWGMRIRKAGAGYSARATKQAQGSRRPESSPPVMRLPIRKFPLVTRPVSQISRRSGPP